MPKTLAARFSTFVLLLCSMAGSLAGIAQEEGTIEQREFFEKRIRPVLVERCYKCHSSESEKVKGGLLLDTREGLVKGGDNGAVIVPGYPEKSRLIEAIRYTNDDFKMPPKHKLS